MGVRVIDIINDQVKAVKKELAEYRATHDFLDPRNNHDLTPHMCRAKLDALSVLKKALRKAKRI